LEVFPRSWNIIFVIDCFNRTYWLAGAAIHALIRLDVKHAIAFVNAVHWTLFDAGLVLHIDTWLGNHISHENSLPESLAFGLTAISIARL
jgi:hypothetical protein